MDAELERKIANLEMFVALECNEEIEKIRIAANAGNQEAKQVIFFYMQRIHDLIFKLIGSGFLQIEICQLLHRGFMGKCQDLAGECVKEFDPMKNQFEKYEELAKKARENEKEKK